MQLFFQTIKERFEPSVYLEEMQLSNLVTHGCLWKAKIEQKVFSSASLIVKPSLKIIAVAQSAPLK